MKYGLFLFAAIVLLTTTSCSNNYKYFTQDLYDDYQWTERELEKIQFYVSDDIILYRRLGAENAKIAKGKIRVVDGSEVEEVVIKKGTPGVFVKSPKDNRFAVSFDPSGNDFLMFGPNAKANGRYLLLAKEWDRRVGKVSYGSQIYETTTASAYAALMVDLKKAKKVKYKTKTVDGARVR